MKPRRMAQPHNGSAADRVEHKRFDQCVVIVDRIVRSIATNIRVWIPLSLARDLPVVVDAGNLQIFEPFTLL
jgi:hypothetical protein